VRELSLPNQLTPAGRPFGVPVLSTQQAEPPILIYAASHRSGAVFWCLHADQTLLVHLGRSVARHFLSGDVPASRMHLALRAYKSVHGRPFSAPRN
jgi:hypothetical protein